MIEVSVIIAAYNIGPYIERAINSALAQEGITIEVIVVDDCSTDDTWEVVSRIANPRVNAHRNAENCGPGASRNKAISMAKGQWIAILDGDDEFLPGRLARCLVHAGTADVIVDNIEIRREADRAAFPMFPATEFSRKAGIDLTEFIERNCFFTKSRQLGYLKPIFRTAFLRENNLGYNPALRIGEDYMLMAEILAASGLCIIEPTIGYAYTVRAGSISHRLSLDDIDHILEADEAFLERYALKKPELKAQKCRRKSLEKARNFTRLVNAIKHRNLFEACYIAFAHPIASFQLWRPLLVRLKWLQTGQ